jgi:hypothetical protein
LESLLAKRVTNPLQVANVANLPRNGIELAYANICPHLPENDESYIKMIDYLYHPSGLVSGGQK